MAGAPQPPKDAYQPFVPTADRPFDDRRVAHLFRRAGFGPTSAWLEKYHNRPPAEALDWLFNYDVSEDELNDKLEEFTGLVSFQKIDAVQEWCLFRMVYTPRPLQEKVMLFWHDHFATSNDKV